MDEKSILITIKKMLGIEADYEAFDTDIIALINSSLMVLTQLGVGKLGFVLVDAKQTWADFLGDKLRYQTDTASYIYYRVRLAFDPPASSFVAESYKELIKEAEWRLNVEYETPFEELEEG
ncbi:MAG: hypothetical protein [Chaetfec virus UA24_144]|nr:MAG: hypothetical protein [Chaetfec virus UA24_144]